MKKFFARFRNSVAAGAIALAAFGANMIFTAPAYANNGDGGSVHDQQDEVRRAFEQFDFVPGKRWYRLSGPRTELPASVVAQVEAQTGQILCKRQNERGEWESNLKVCPTDHPQMNDPSIGLLNPRRDRNGPIFDYIGQNYAYDMPTRLTDMPIARAIDAQYATYLADRRDRTQTLLASVDTGTATGAPTDIRPAAQRQRTQVARNTRLPNTAPLPRERPADAPVVVAEAPVVLADAPVVVAALEPVELAPAANIQIADLATLPTLQLAAADPAPVVAERTTRVRAAAPVMVAANTDGQSERVRRLFASVAAEPTPTVVAAAAPVQNDRVRRLFESVANTNDTVFSNPLLQLAANDSTIPAADQLRATAVMRSAPAQKQGEPVSPDNKSKFNLVAVNDRFEPKIVAGGPDNDDAWVTPRGRQVQFEVFNNGRFRAAAPALMAA